MQGRSRDTDVENKLMVTKRRKGGGMNQEAWIDIYTLPCVKQITVMKTFCVAQGTLLGVL